MSGINVTATDVDTGESDSVVIENDYVLICDGTCTMSVQAHANGTHVITIKGRSAAGEDR